MNDPGHDISTALIEQGFWAPPECPYLEIRSTVDSRKPYAAHFHSGFSLGLILGGRTRFVCGREEHLAETGDLVLIEPEMVHNCNPVDGEARSYHMLHLDRNWCLDLAARSPDSTLRLKKRVLKDKDVFGQISRFVEKVQKGIFEDEAAFAALVGRLLKDLSAEAAGPSEESGGRRLLERFAVEMLFSPKQNVGFVEDIAFTGRGMTATEAQIALAGNLENPLPVVEVARRLGLRRESFIRRFRRGRGLTPGAFQQCLRLLEGRRLLRQGHSIAEAAAAAGYADQSHFHRMFVRYFSATPRQYRLNRSLFYKK